MLLYTTVGAQDLKASYKFYDAVFCSQARLTYTKVGALLQSPDSEMAQEVRSRYPKVASMLNDMYDVFHALRGQREERGEFEIAMTLVF